MNYRLPNTLKDVLTMYFRSPELALYSGGTDLMVAPSCENNSYIFINRIPELKIIKASKQYTSFGSACTFTEVLNSEFTPDILKQACKEIAAPAIRNVGTIGGNIANGSAKADSALIFMVTNSLLRLQTLENERLLPIRDFYLGGGKTALKESELITEILIPSQNLDNYYYEKVGARKALSISRVSFAAILDVQNSIIENCATAFGAVSDTIIRPAEIDKILISKSLSEARNLKADYLAALDKAIIPRRGRVSIEFRKDVCMNLVRDFLTSNGI